MNNKRPTFFHFSAILIMLCLCFATTAISGAPRENKEINALLTQGEKAYDKEHYVEAMKCFMQARKKAEAANRPEDLSLALYNIGVCYFFISENGEAMRYFYEAYKISQTCKAGWKSDSRIVNGIAGVYFAQNDYARALETINPVYQEALNKKDSAFIVTYASDMALIANKQGRYTDAARYIKEAKAYSRNKQKDLPCILSFETETLFLQKKYKELIPIAQQILDNPYSLNSEKAITLIYLMNIYSSRGDFGKAFSYAARARQIAPLKHKPDLFTTMATLYEKTGNFHEALACKDSVIACNDSLGRMSNRQLAENTKAKLDIFRLTTDYDRQLDRMHQKHRIYLLIICICLLLMIIAVIINQYMRGKRNHERQLMLLRIEKEHSQKQIAEEQMKTAELEAEFRHEMIKRDLEQKRRELSATTMFIASRNELIENLLRSLETIPEVRRIAEINDLMMSLDRMVKKDNEHDNFLVRFEQSDPEFIRKLTAAHSGLTVSDIRFLSYVRMNLSLKDIASLLNINPESCKRRKIRLSKKLGLDGSSNLYDYILGM